MSKKVTVSLEIDAKDKATGTLKILGDSLKDVYKELGSVAKQGEKATKSTDGLTSASKGVQVGMGQMIGAIIGAEIVMSSFRFATDLAKEAIMFLRDTFVDFIRTGLETSMSMEKIETRMTTLTGSAEDAREAIAKMKKDALDTPFNIEGLSQMNSLLMSAGLDSERARKLILNLGDAVAATGGSTVELERMGINLQQIKNLGHATAVDIKQFAYAGIDIYGLLADSMGKTREELQAMSTTDITFEMIEKALADAAAEGGKFHGAMKDMSETLPGRIERVQEAWQFLSADFVETSGITDMVSTGLGIVAKMLDGLRDPLMKIGGWFKGVWEDIVKKVRAFASGDANLLKEAFGENADRVAGFANKLGEMWEKLKEAGATITETLEDSDMFQGSMDNLGNTIVDQILTNLELFIDYISDLATWITENEDTIEQWATTIVYWITVIIEKVGESIEKWQKFRNFLSDFGMAAHAIGQAIFGPIIDVAQPLLEQILGIEAALNRLKKKATEALQAGANAAANINTQALVYENQGYTVPANVEYSGNGTFATGTDFYPGGWGITGEEGPELVKFPRGTQIIPHDESQKMLRGGATVNVNFTGDVRMDNAQRIDELVTKIEMAIGNRINLDGYGG